jgi:hypothetical protein
MHWPKSSPIPTDRDHLIELDLAPFYANGVADYKVRFTAPPWSVVDMNRSCSVHFFLGMTGTITVQ